MTGLTAEHRERAVSVELWAGRRGHHWRSLTQTPQLSVTSVTFSARLSCPTSNSSHVGSFISTATPEPIQLELYTTSWKSTTCGRDSHG